MRDMGADGYAPKSRPKALRLLKQALKWAVAQDPIAKNPCDFRKPPRRARAPINAPSREERTRMLRLAMEAEPQPLGFAAEIALATGMGRGEACALRWPDLSDDGGITVSHALGNGPGGFYVKEPKAGSSARTIPPPSTWTRRSPPGGARGARDGSGARRPLRTGNAGGGGLPRNPTRLGEDLSAFRRVSGLSRAFHDPRRTLATMMIAGGCDVRTVASYLGHASVSVTLDV